MEEHPCVARVGLWAGDDSVVEQNKASQSPRGTWVG